MKHDVHGETRKVCKIMNGVIPVAQDGWYLFEMLPTYLKVIGYFAVTKLNDEQAMEVDQIERLYEGRLVVLNKNKSRTNVWIMGQQYDAYLKSTSTERWPVSILSCYDKTKPRKKLSKDERDRMAKGFLDEVREHFENQKKIENSLASYE